MRFTTITVASAAFASTTFAAPWEHGVKNVWNGRGYGGFGKHKQKDYESAPAPPSYETGPSPPSYETPALPPPSYETTPVSHPVYGSSSSSYGTTPPSGVTPPPSITTSASSQVTPPPPGTAPTFTTPGNGTTANPTSPGSPGTTGIPGVPPPLGNSTCPTTPDGFCITPVQGQHVADIFRQLISGYTLEFALEVLTEDFIDYSSAVNIIRNRGNDYPFTVNDLTFENRAEFAANHGRQPPIPFDTLKVWNGCDTVTVQWQTLRSANQQPTEADDIPVVGLGLLQLVPDSGNSYGFRISALYSEFNSAAWLVNNGVFTPSAVTTSAFPTATDTASGANMRMDLPQLAAI